MFGSFIVIGGVSAAAFMFYFIMPMAGIAISVGYLVLLGMMIQVSHLDIFLSPLGKHELINLHITKSRKIVPEIVKEEEGYAQRRGWGLHKVAEDTRHTFCGKPTIITAEGIPYSLRLEEAYIAKLLAKTGMQSKQELAKFLELPDDVLGITKKMKEDEDDGTENIPEGEETEDTGSGNFDIREA